MRYGRWILFYVISYIFSFFFIKLWSDLKSIVPPRSVAQGKGWCVSSKCASGSGSELTHLFSHASRECILNISVQQIRMHIYTQHSHHHVDGVFLDGGSWGDLSANTYSVSGKFIVAETVVSLKFCETTFFGGNGLLLSAFFVVI